MEALMKDLEQRIAQRIELACRAAQVQALMAAAQHCFTRATAETNLDRAMTWIDAGFDLIATSSSVHAQSLPVQVASAFALARAQHHFTQESHYGAYQEGISADSRAGSRSDGTGDGGDSSTRRA
jgi:hypothetical protein